MPRWLYALLIVVPIALLARGMGAAHLFVFILAAIALVPLAGLIGVATEALAEHIGPSVGGLLNATFGNAAELIIGLAAISAGLPDVVRASITGSIAGNALLVLGSSMMVGGWRFGLQTFNARNAGQYASMMALAVVGLVIPSLVATGGGHVSGQEVVAGLSLNELSYAVAAILLLSYIAYIAFSVFGLRAGPHAIRRRSEEGVAPDDVIVSAIEEEEARARAEESQEGKAHAGSDGSDNSTDRAGSGDEHSGYSGERHPNVDQAPLYARVVEQFGAFWRRSPWAAVIVLGLATALTAVVSEALVGTIEPLTHEIGLSPFFVGLIILPIVGNAAEHTSAITMAVRDRMEVTMAITAGSSIQVALLVAPMLILASPVFGKPLDLEFTRLELLIFALIAGIYALVSLDGESTWLEGLQLCAFYLIVAVVAFFIPV